MHYQITFELEHDRPIAHLAAPHLGVHDVEEGGIGPPTWLPKTDLSASAEELHGGPHSESNTAEIELQVKLPDPDLCRELPDDRGKVKIIGDSVHKGV
ncbi:hypothetical protein KF840_06560 [bacterium]|nr:hypothetical protein [bacterium]